jgi:hypothetical protein
MAPKMPVMPGDDHPTEEPTADPGEKQTAAEPHADIVARLLDYQRRLREETGDKPAEAGEGAWTPRRVEPDPSAVGETSDEGSDPARSVEPAPTLRVSGEEASEPPDVRQLKERIDRLDETLARISAMLPLLKGETKRDPQESDPGP